MALARMAPVAALRSSAQIHSVLRRGAIAHGAVMVAHALSRADDGPARVAFVAGRKVGGAVQRNRAKRRLRGAVRSVELPSGVDLVVVARPQALAAPADVLARELGAVTNGAARRAREARR